MKMKIDHTAIVSGCYRPTTPEGLSLAAKVKAEEDAYALKHRMEGVREYAENMDVRWDVEKGRLVVRAYNQAGYDSTAVDLEDLLKWCAENAEMLKAIKERGDE